MRIVVIGAGIIGLATAAELVARGHEVVAIDPAPASGASHAAAGMLAAGAEAAWGQERLLPLMRTAADAYPAFVSGLAGGAAAVGYRATGTLAVGVDAADRETLSALAGLPRPHGLPAEAVTGTRARELEPALGPAVTAAMLFPDDHRVDPRRITAALLSALGDRVRTAAVRAVVHTAGRVSGVRLATGVTVDAEAVVAAPGLGVPGIAGLPALPLRPVWGDVVRLRVPSVLRPLLTCTVRALVRGRPLYLVPRDDGTLVLGASVREGGVPGVQAGAVLTLLRDAELVAPGIGECEIVETLARPRPATPDALPLLGRTEPGLVLSTGLDRHGILLAPLAAALGADLVEGRAVDAETAAALDPLRFAAAGADAPLTALATSAEPAPAEPVGAGRGGR